MREILFRGRATTTGGWLEGDLLQYAGSAQIWTTDTIDGGKWNYEVVPSTVGQYTGLTDKNGKKIFEGDIIRMHGNQDDIAVVQFGEFGCVDIELESITDRVNGWHYKPLATDALSQLEPFCWEFQLNKMWVEQNDIEIIGNIHDNTELLKGDNDAAD